MAVPDATGLALTLDNSKLFGLGLYGSLAAVVVLEAALPLIGILLYVQYTLKMRKTRLT